MPVMSTKTRVSEQTAKVLAKKKKKVRAKVSVGIEGQQPSLPSAVEQGYVSGTPTKTPQLTKKGAKEVTQLSLGVELPQGKVHPNLEKHAITGGIDNLNQKVQAATEAWYKYKGLDQTGLVPLYGEESEEAHNVGTTVTIKKQVLAPPGLIWDLARSNVSIQDITPDLFSVPTDKRSLLIKSINKTGGKLDPLEALKVYEESQKTMEQETTQNVFPGLTVPEPGTVPTTEQTEINKLSSQMAKQTNKLEQSIRMSNWKQLDKQDLETLSGLRTIVTNYDRTSIPSEKDLRNFLRDNHDSVMKLIQSSYAPTVGAILDEITEKQKIPTKFISRVVSNATRYTSDAGDIFGYTVGSLAMAPFAMKTIGESAFNTFKEGNVVTWNALINIRNPEKHKEWMKKRQAKLKREGKFGNPKYDLGALGEELGKAIVKQFQAEWNDPGANKGAIVFDALAFGTTAVGGLTRAGLAGKALATPKTGTFGRVGLAGKALVGRRPMPTAPLLVNGESYVFGLSESPLISFIEKRKVKGWQKIIDAMGKSSVAGEDAVKLALSDRILASIGESMASGKTGKLFGPFAKLRKETTKQHTINSSAQMSAAVPFEQSAGMAVGFDEKMLKVRSKLSPEEDRAFLISVTNASDPLGAWERFHKFFIDNAEELAKARGYRAEDIIANHLYHLEQLEKAAPLLEKPSKRLQKAMREGKKLQNETEIKQQYAFGFDEELQKRRVLIYGTFVENPDLLLKHLKGEVIDVTPTGAPAMQLATKSGERRVVRKSNPYRAIPYTDDSGREMIRINILDENRNPRAVETSYPLTEKGIYDMSAAGYLDELDNLKELKVWLYKKGLSIDEAEIARVKNTLRMPGIKTKLKSEELYPKYDVTKIEEKNPNAMFVSTAVPKPNKKLTTAAPRGYLNDVGGVGGTRIPALHSFSGDTLATGNFRVDVSNLIMENYSTAVRVTARMDLLSSIQRLGTDTYKEGWMPMLKEGKWSRKYKELKGRVESGQLLGSDLIDLSPEDEAMLLDKIIPKKTYEQIAKDGELDNYVWVPPNAVSHYVTHIATNGKLQNVFDAINAPLVFLTLYLRPTYIYNGISQGLMTGYNYGFLRSGRIAASAVRLKSVMGEDLAAFIDALSGQTRTGSYHAGDISSARFASQWTVKEWQKVTDLTWRRTAVLAEGERLGYKIGDKEAWSKLRTAKDEKTIADRNLIANKANAAQVDFRNLSWVEQQYLRHMFFVYPWMSRSIVWCVKEMIEHPVKTDLLLHIVNATEEQDPWLAHLPKFYKEMGYFPVAYNKEGDPYMVNWSSINTFSSLTTLKNFYKDPQAIANSFGPFAKALAGIVNAKDVNGDPLTGNLINRVGQEAYSMLIYSTSQGRALANEFRKQNKLDPIDWSNKDALVKREHQLAEQLAFDPNWRETMGFIIAGGAFPRLGSKERFEAKAWKDVDPIKRMKHEKNLIFMVLKKQEELLGLDFSEFEEKTGNIKGSMKNGIEFANTLATQEAIQAKKRGRELNNQERNLLRVDMLVTENYLTPQQGKAFSKRLNEAAHIGDTEGVQDIMTLVNQSDPTRVYSKWDTYVREYLRVANKQVSLFKMGRLLGDDLIEEAPVKAKQTDFLEYGKRYAKYMMEKDRLAIGMLDDSLSKDDKESLQSEFFNLEDVYDVPVMIGKHTFPSLPRMDWAKKTPEDQQKAIDSWVTKPWGTLSGLQKEILTGKKAKNQLGWEILRKFRIDFKKANDRGPNKDEIVGAVNTIDRYYSPGFKSDYGYSTMPVIKRFMQTKDYNLMEPKVKKSFDELASYALAYNQAINNDVTSAADGKKDWKAWVTSPAVRAWITEQPELHKWLLSYDEDYETKFLMKFLTRSTAS